MGARASTRDNRHYGRRAALSRKAKPVGPSARLQRRPLRQGGCGMKRKVALSTDEYLRLGAELRRAEDSANDVLDRLSEAFPLSSPVARQAYACVRTIRDLRSGLENTAASEYGSDFALTVFAGRSES